MIHSPEFLSSIVLFPVGWRKESQPDIVAVWVDSQFSTAGRPTRIGSKLWRFCCTRLRCLCQTPKEVPNVDQSAVGIEQVTSFPPSGDVIQQVRCARCAECWASR